MPWFLGLKSYLTTDRSNIAKQEIIKARRSLLTRRELLREDIADKLKCPLCFGVPCFAGAVLLLILTVLYVTMPFSKGLNFEESLCTVQRIEFSEKGGCSHSTEQFKPCYKIMVVYNTTGHQAVSVLMENEQTNSHCDKCSYTFGKGSLFQKHRCTSTPRSCVVKYNEQYGKINSRYPCFYDPGKPSDVFRTYKISRSEVIYQTLLPALFILLYILGFMFVRYDEVKRRKMNKEIKQKRHRHAVANRRRHPEITSDSKSNSSATSDSPSSSGSTVAMYRVRKKKMPCTKIHAFSTRDDEDVIMEEKPISPAMRKQSSEVFMQVNVDKLAPHCACVKHQSVSSSFELARVKENFRPVIAAQYHTQSQLRRSRKALRYLPESIV